MSGLAYYGSYRWQMRNSYHHQKLDYWYGHQPSGIGNSFYVEFLELRPRMVLGAR